MQKCQLSCILREAYAFSVDLLLSHILQKSPALECYNTCWQHRKYDAKQCEHFNGQQKKSPTFWTYDLPVTHDCICSYKPQACNEHYDNYIPENKHIPGWERREGGFRSQVFRGTYGLKLGGEGMEGYHHDFLCGGLVVMFSFLKPKILHKFYKLKRTTGRETIWFLVVMFWTIYYVHLHCPLLINCQMQYSNIQTAV